MTAVNEATAVVMHDDDIRATLVNVLGECSRQVGKWGIQHHPDGTGPAYLFTLLSDGMNHARLADEAKAITDAAAERGSLTWKDILLEEVFEALAEHPDSDALVTELVQVAAVAVSWATDVLNRRHPSY